MDKYLVIIERTESGTFGAYSPDLPGCFATGQTMEDVERRMLNAMRGHIAFLREEGKEVPKPMTAAASFVVLETEDAASAA